MLIKAILVGLVLGLCKSEWIYGFPQVGRPIVVSTLTGLFLGDPVQGVIMGSVLELMFIGSFPIGAAVSPDYTSAGAICSVFCLCFCLHLCRKCSSGSCSKCNSKSNY